MTEVPTLREVCPYSEFLWSVFSRIRIEYEEILCISPYSVRMRENADQKNSKYGHFSHSERSQHWLMSGTNTWLLVTVRWIELYFERSFVCSLTE